MKVTMTTVCSLSRPNVLHFHAQKNISSSSFTSSSNTLIHFQCHVSMFNAKPTSSLVLSSKKQFVNSRQVSRNSVICSVGEEDEVTVVPAEDEVEAAPVSVPVSPSDLLTMFFQAEGTMSEAAIPSVTSALQETEGITNLKVQVVEGIASVELMKQTTIQATGVASNLLETIQGSGFKLQTLNLSFEDEEEIPLLVESIDKEHEYAKTSAMALPPTKMPRHHYHHQAPAEAPLHHSVEHHHRHPHHTHVPACSPTKAEAPTPSMTPKHGCRYKCDEYCKKKEHHEKTRCVEAFTVCCDKYRCVPQHNKKCINWDHVNVHGKLIKCP